MNTNATKQNHDWPRRPLTDENRELLQKLDSTDFPPFTSQPVIREEAGWTFDHLDTLQVNVGKRCNLKCKHCHIQAGPDRTEEMDRETIDACLTVFRENHFKVLDLTGGSPEMNPDIRYFIEEGSKIADEVIVRSNLVIFEEPGYEDFPEFYAKNHVTIFASLPHYDKATMERQRGAGSYDAVIDGIRKLNGLGYGKDASESPDGKLLILNLIYNPGGAFLPPDQSALTLEFGQKLNDAFGIHFNTLYAMTNNPIGRFGKWLVKSRNLKKYMNKLIGAFNPAAAENIMCRSQLSVDWDGSTHDCDFNLALGLHARCPDIRDLAASGEKLGKRQIVLANHCYACTAGAGSS